MPSIGKRGHPDFLNLSGYRCVQRGRYKRFADADKFSKGNLLFGLDNRFAGRADILKQGQNNFSRRGDNLYGRAG